MNNKVRPPPRDWVKAEWRAESAAGNEESRWPDETAVQGTKDVNKLKLLQHSGRLAVVLMWVFAIAYVASMGVWLLHFLTPYGWLATEQLSKIQTVIFSGSLGAVVTVFVQKHIS